MAAAIAGARFRKRPFSRVLVRASRAGREICDSSSNPAHRPSGFLAHQSTSYIVGRPSRFFSKFPVAAGAKDISVGEPLCHVSVQWMWRVSSAFQGSLGTRCHIQALENGGKRYASGMTSTELGDRNVDIFDRVLKTKHRDRAARSLEAGDSLLEAVTENLLDRLDDCKRTFPAALNVGGAFHHVKRLVGKRGGVEKMMSLEISKEMVDKSVALMDTNEWKHGGGGATNVEHMHVVGDEEFLPFGEDTFDVVISSLGLHWVNDLPGAMSQCRMALKPDGLFLGAMLGGETLKELRIACTVAQLEREGGFSPRVSPLARVRDAGNLLQRAGLALPAVDTDEYVVRYPSALELIEHLRMMGEISAVRERNPMLRRDTALATAAIYESMFGDEDGSIPATFQVIYMAGWKPAPTQQTPKRRGSATASFHDLQKAFPSKENADS